MRREYGVCYKPEPSISSLALIPINVRSRVNKDLLDKYYGLPAERPFQTNKSWQFNISRALLTKLYGYTWFRNKVVSDQESVRKKWKPKKGIKVWVNVNKYWLYEIIKIIYCRIKNIVKYLHKVMNESESLYFLKGRKSRFLTVEFDKLNICTIILGSSKADIYTPKLKGK